jgi:ParB family transcriptional regulator, chromosome partitioning protein
MAGFTKRPKTDADLAATQKALLGLATVAPAPETATPPVIAATTLTASPSLTPQLDAPPADFGARQNGADALVYVVGMVYDIPVAMLVSNPVGPRSIYTHSDVDDMSLKLQRDGQRQSATAFVNKNGAVTMIDGETRLRAARNLGWTSLRVEIKPMPEDERALYEDARSANSDRRAQSPFDDALRWRDMLNRNVYTNQGDLAKSLNLGDDIISRTVSLTEIPMRVIHIVSEYPEMLRLRMLNAIREFYQIRGEDETIELVNKINKDGLGYRDVIAMRKAAERPPAKRPRSSKEAFTYQGIRGELRVFAEEGRVELAIKGLDGEAVTALHEKIKDALQGL